MSEQLYVWDRVVRSFHWLLVLSFTIAYLSAEEIEWLHDYASYVVLGLLGIRIVWGLVGSRHARFSDFLYSPGQALGYLRGLFSDGAKRYIGHSPAGGLMVFLLIFSIGVTGLSGLMLESEEQATGAGQISEYDNGYAPEYDDDDREHEDESHELWEEVHEFFADVSVFLVFLHIAGVLLSSLMHEENLIRAMLTGYKRNSDH